MGREEREGRGCQTLSWDPTGAAVLIPLFGEKSGCDVWVLRRCAATAQGKRNVVFKISYSAHQVLAHMSAFNIRLTNREGRLVF